MIELFDYQAQAVADLRQAYRAGYRAPLLVMPTGAGKTVCFTFMCQQAVAKGLRVLILVHRRELVQQVSAALDRWAVLHGRITAGEKPTDLPVQVAMVQTLARRLRHDDEGRYRFDLVIIDEAHHGIRESSWGRVLAHNAEARLLGVTATPCRLDGNGLGRHAGGCFDHLVIGPSVAELIEQGRLARPVVYAPAKALDLRGVAKRGGDYAMGALAARMDQRALTGDAVTHYRQLCAGLPSIAFCITREHAAHVCEDFQAGGFQSAMLTGETPDKTRAEMIRDLGTGALQVLVSCNVVSEGTDIPQVGAAILLRPTASYALAMQQMGRSLRTAKGKTHAIILDHAGNCHRHGLPTDAVEWSLDGVKRRAQADLKPCYGCGALMPRRDRVCASCGHVIPANPKDISSDVALPFVENGELVELTPSMRSAMRRKRLAEERLAESPEDLVRLGRARGYKHPDGWARHRYAELRRTS